MILTFSCSFHTHHGVDALGELEELDQCRDQVECQQSRAQSDGGSCVVRYKIQWIKRQYVNKQASNKAMNVKQTTGLSSPCNMSSSVLSEKFKPSFFLNLTEAETINEQFSVIIVIIIIVIMRLSVQFQNHLTDFKSQVVWPKQQL